MRLPAYVILPISGAVVLTAAVLGSWLWPALSAPSSDSATPTVSTSVAAGEPSPSFAPLPPPSRPVSRPMAVKPVVPAQPSPNFAATPSSEPVVVAPPPPPPSPSPGAQITDLSPEARAEIKQKYLSLRGRASEIAQRGVTMLEGQREEARARGDQAEVDRLDERIRQLRDQLEKMRALKPEVPPTSAELPIPAQVGPPVE